MTSVSSKLALTRGESPAVQRFDALLRSCAARGVGPADLDGAFRAKQPAAAPARARGRSKSLADRPAVARLADLRGPNLTEVHPLDEAALKYVHARPRGRSASDDQRSGGAADDASDDAALSREDLEVGVRATQGCFNCTST